MQINFPKTVNRYRWESIEEIILEANEIARTTKTSRSKVEVIQDSMNGLTLQYAVADALQEAGYYLSIAPRDDKTFDFEISGIRFDVKGMFKVDATTFGQSTWERINAAPSTIYLCYDCRGANCEYSGWCRHGDFQASKFKDYFIYPNRLNK